MQSLCTRIFVDSANANEMIEFAQNPIVAGFTTNPTLMRKSGVSHYSSFCQNILEKITRHPISFEVFADDLHEMERQARVIASWGSNVYVKIPVTNTKRIPTTEIIKKLSFDGIKINVTAIMTLNQVENVIASSCATTPIYISVFAGRIADTGLDPLPLMKESLKIIKNNPRARLLWASPREILNILQANQIGCHIITVTADILKKLSLHGKNLEDYSLETVQMFYDDAKKAGYTL